jgi:hypothetical protein
MNKTTANFTQIILKTLCLSIVFGFSTLVRAQDTPKPQVAQDNPKPQVILFDSFKLNGTTRVAGGSLDGQSPETGTGTWTAINAVFSASGIIVTPGDNLPFAGGEIAISNPNSTITVQADVVTNNREPSWFAVGFQNGPNMGNWFSVDDQLFVDLRPSGGWELIDYKGSTLTVVMSGSIPDFVSTNTYTLALQYDPTSQKASVLVNGENISGPHSVTLSSSIGSAGFCGYKVVKAGTASVGNFKVSIAPASKTGN